MQVVGGRLIAKVDVVAMSVFAMCLLPLTADGQPLGQPLTYANTSSFAKLPELAPFFEGHRLYLVRWEAGFQ